MTYDNPQLVKLDSTLNSILGLPKPCCVFYGNKQPPYPHDATMAAYEPHE
jgi:hypothetical protein